MEALEQLKSVQVTLLLMREHSLCSHELSGQSSDRFMAEFFLFLIQRCANADDLKMSCDILIKQLPKVSMAFMQALVGEKCTVVGLDASDCCQDAVKVLSTGCVSPLEKDTVVTPSLPGNYFSLGKAGEYNCIHSPKIFMKENMHVSKPCAILMSSSEQPSSSLQLVPLVGMRAMERANSTLEDFCRSYFMFHGMDVHNPQHVFKYLPILSFVEAFIYQLDEENEDQIQLSNGGTAAFPSRSSCSLSEGSGGYFKKNQSVQNSADIKAPYNRDEFDISGPLSMGGLGSQPFQELQHILASHGLLTERIKLELRDGVEYWRLEKALCESVTMGDRINLDDVFRAVKLKSFDYRVLNLLLYSLTKREVNETHCDFLAVSELLVEISDDLFDYEVKQLYSICRKPNFYVFVSWATRTQDKSFFVYEGGVPLTGCRSQLQDDVLKNSFNILRMLVKVYGPTEAPEVLAKLISEEELMYQRLLEGLQPDLARQYEERCKEATNEGL